MWRSIPSMICLLVAAVFIEADPAASGLESAQKQNDARHQRAEHGLAMLSKLLASGVFVIGREPEEFIRTDLQHYTDLGLPDWKEINVSIDRSKKSVTLKTTTLPARTAVYCGDQGCVLLPRGETKVSFQPVAITPALPDPKAQKWPMGDTVDGQTPRGVDREMLSAAIDFAFDDGAQSAPQQTRTLLVVYKGQIIAERYRPGFQADTRHICWSMGKSITAALIGILIGQGHFKVDDRAPIEQWGAPSDRRSEITIADLLHMSSGLKFESPSDVEGMFSDRDNHRFVYFGAVNVFDYSVNRDLEFPPNTVWRYRNCDPLSLGLIIRRTVEARGEQYLSFPQRALFDQIGMRSMVLEVDSYGNFIMTGFDYGTARDWARFGLLHLNDGVWDGKRLLPAGWVGYMATAAPANAQKNYGALFWLNRGGQYAALPRDMYWPAGHHGQVVLIIPSCDMVIVRLGHSARGGFDAYLEPVVKRILAACRH